MSQEQTQHVEASEQSVDQYLDDVLSADNPFNDEASAQGPEQVEPEYEEQSEQVLQEEESQDEQGAQYEYSKFWSDEEKAAFDNLPDEAKEAALLFDRQREAFTTRKSQELSDRMRKVESLEALGQALNADPNFREHVAAYGQQAQAEPQQQQEEQPPEDPFERLKWEAMKEAEAKIMEKLAPQLQQQQMNAQQLQHQQVINAEIAKLQADPDYASTHQKVVDYIQNEFAGLHGEAEAKKLWNRLDQDPRAYRNIYDKMKASDGGETKQPETIERKVTPQKPVLAKRGAPPQSPQSKAQRIRKATESVVSNGKVNHTAVNDLMNLAFGDNPYY